jgi:hypothetical protein
MGWLMFLLPTFFGQDHKKVLSHELGLPYLTNFFTGAWRHPMLMLNHRLQRAFSISWLAGAGQSRGASDGAAVAWQHGLLPILTGTC